MTGDSVEVSAMPDEVNGDRFVTRHEWRGHLQVSADATADTKRKLDEHEKRIDKMEARWDRYAGPIVVLLVLMGVVSTVASIWGASVR